MAYSNFKPLVWSKHIQRELEGGQGVFRRVCTRAAVGLNLNHAMTPFLHKICLIIQPGRGG